MNGQRVFDLEIITPQASELHSISWIEVEGLESSFTVGHSHSPLVCILRPASEISYSKMDGSIIKLEVSAGVFSVSSQRAVLIID